MPNVIEKATRAINSYRDLMFEQPSPRRIKRFLIAVNGWCNSKCTFCNIWKYDKKLALTEEVTLEELERNLFSAKALEDVLDIGITGGEPFLRRDIVELCTSMFTHFKKAHVGAVTNCIRYERVVEAAVEIAAKNPDRAFSIAISLDGYGDTHDTVRGVPGNFERILKGISLLREQAPGVMLAFSHTVTPNSMQDSVRCYELAQELGIGFIYRLAHDAPYLRNEGDKIWSDEALVAVRPVVEELNRRIVNDQTVGARLGNTNYASIAFYEQIMDYFDNPRRTFECHSGTHSFLLAHDGNVHPCVTLPDSMGNVRTQHFDDLWFSAQADAVRKPIAEWKCHCWTNCETEMSLARDKSSFVSSMSINLRSFAPNSQPAPTNQPAPAPASTAASATTATSNGHAQNGDNGSNGKPPAFVPTPDADVIPLDSSVTVDDR